MIDPIQLKTSGEITNRSGTITAGGTAQDAAAENVYRRYLLIVNVSDAVLWVNFGATAAATQPAIPLKACAASGDGSGGSIVFEGSFVPQDRVSVYGATTGKPFICKEG